MEGKAPASRDADEVDLALSLGSIYAAAPASPPPPPPPPSPPLPVPRPPPPPAPRAIRLRRRVINNGAGRVGRPCIKPRDAAGDDGAQEAPPFPWATERPAQHDTLESLLRRGVTSVQGQTRCKRCGARKAIVYDLEDKFWELREYIVSNRHTMYDRAPDAWTYPVLPDCDACGHRSAMWPEIASEKSEINWLFLLLGQMLGCCTLEQLKYFCKNTGRHRTGAKNRVLFYAYIEMSNQLQSFD